MLIISNMHNNNLEQKGQYCPPMSPRISFSNDFAESHIHQNQLMMKQERSSRDHHHQAAGSGSGSSSDFEFSVSNYSMMSADELFSKGKLLPFKDGYRSSGSNPMQRTLREELLVDDDKSYNNGASVLRPPKGSTAKWKGFLGLKRTHIGSRKTEKSSTDNGDRIGNNNNFGFVHQQPHSNNSQEFLMEGDSSCRDEEFGT